MIGGRAHTQPSILLVDDDDDARDALAAVLEEEGFLVRSAANGVEALQRLAEDDRPSVILSDLTMPGMSGWELADAIGANSATAAIPLCVMTALPAGHDIPEHAVAVLRKPIEPERLVSVLRRCVGDTSTVSRPPSTN